MIKYIAQRVVALLITLFIILTIAFLVIQNGSVKVLQVQAYQNTADRVVGMVPDVIDKVSGLVSGVGKKDPAREEDASPAPSPAPDC